MSHQICKAAHFTAEQETETKYCATRKRASPSKVERSDPSLCSRRHQTYLKKNSQYAQSPVACRNRSVILRQKNKGCRQPARGLCPHPPSIRASTHHRTVVDVPIMSLSSSDNRYSPDAALLQTSQTGEKNPPSISITMAVSGLPTNTATVDSQLSR